MNEPKDTERETEQTTSLTSMATGLEKLIGRKLTDNEITAHKEKLSGAASENENLEDLFTNYVELINAWDLEAHGPAIAEVGQHVQAALRGFIPTGDGVVDEQLGLLIGKLVEIDQTNTGRMVGTPEQWQTLQNVLKETQGLMNDISQSPKVNGKKLETAYSHIIEAVTTINPNAKVALSSLDITLESPDNNKPVLF